MSKGSRVREVLEKALDKYSFTRGYPCGGTETRDNAVSNILSGLAEIVRDEQGVIKLCGKGYDTCFDCPYSHECEDYLFFVKYSNHIAKLFTDKEEEE